MIGGGQIYALAMPYATRCEVTEVDIELPRDDDDALAPVLDEAWVGETGEWLTSRSGCATGSTATLGPDRARSSGRRRDLTYSNAGVGVTDLPSVPREGEIWQW